MTKQALLGALLLSLTACAASEGTVSSSTATLDYATFMNEAVALGCRFASECCTPGERVLLGFHDEAQFADACESTARPEIDAFLAQTEAQIEARELAFDAELAARCLEDFRRRADRCAEDRNVIGTELPCDRVLHETATLGEPCRHTCADGQCVDGTCVPLATTGEPCAAGVALCDGGVCRRGLCDSPADLGQACDQSFECLPGLYCRRTATGESGECAAFDICEGP